VEKNMSELTKNIVWDDVKNDPQAVKVLDHGFVVLKETMGSDSTIAESARVSYGAGTKTISDDRNLLRYLIRHNHTSPFEMAEARFLVKVPVFVWRQWIRHRTANVNELSGRYSELPEECFAPEQWRSQSITNKQGGEQPMEYEQWQTGMGYSDEIAKIEYVRRLESGVSRELARTCLPVSHYTIAYWKCDVHNILHFLKLRMHSHAQYEIQVYAQSIYNLLKQQFPITFEAFDDYILNSVKFSRMEQQLLKHVIANTKLTMFTESEAESMGISKREYREFADKVSNILNNK
jgi:thymidylate synthase (FAD)